MAVNYSRESALSGGSQFGVQIQSQEEDGRWATGPSHSATTDVQKVERKKLHNKPLERTGPPRLPAQAEEAQSTSAGHSYSPNQERLIRLSFAALGNRTKPWMTESLGSHESPVSTTAGGSTPSRASTIDEDAVSEFGASSTEDSSGLPQMQQICEKRCGIDVGGVCAEEDEKGYLVEVPGATTGVQAIVEEFGPSNVFLVSKVRLRGKMHSMTKRWLCKAGGFLERTGIPEANVIFVEAVSGRNGKGAVAARLGLSHFVDDKWDVLQSVFSDAAGNSGDLVRHFGGVLFHFAPGGTGKWRFRLPASITSQLHPYYRSVSCWDEVKQRLRQLTNNQVTGAVSALTRCVQVGIPDDGSFRLVERLTGKASENLRYIAQHSGHSQVFLTGRQQSLICNKPEPLAVCILATSSTNFESATQNVNELIAHLRREYSEFVTKNR